MILDSESADVNEKSSFLLLRVAATSRIETASWRWHQTWQASLWRTVAGQRKIYSGPSLGENHLRFRMTLVAPAVYFAQVQL